MALNGVPGTVAQPPEVSAGNHRAALEEATGLVLHEFTGLDTAMRKGAPARTIAVKLTALQLAAAVLQEKICLAQITAWNEL